MTDSRWKSLALEVIGCFVSALGLYSFAVAAGVPVTGVAGIGAILFRLFGLPIGVTNIIMNIPIVLICFKYLGKDFFFRSVRCMVLFAIFTDYVLAALPVYQGDRMLATICGGVISGGLAVFGTMGFSRVGAGVIFALAFLAFSKKVPIGISFGQYSGKVMEKILAIGFSPFLSLASDNVLHIATNTVLQKYGGSQGDFQTDQIPICDQD